MGILDLIMLIVITTVRVLIVVVATPFILAWPRNVKSASYGNAVWTRYKKVLWVAVS